MSGADRAIETARAVAAWHLGDPSWADLLVGAYLNPEAARIQLACEKAEDWPQRKAGPS